MTPTPKQDLRNHPRFPIHEAVVRLTRRGLLSSIASNQARGAVNLSEGGILLRTARRLDTGARVRVTVDLEKFGDHLVSEGEVRWCGESARDKNGFFVGIRFDALSAADRQKIGQMRTWFTSPEYRVKSSTRRNTIPPGP